MRRPTDPAPKVESDLPPIAQPSFVQLLEAQFGRLLWSEELAACIDPRLNIAHGMRWLLRPTFGQHEGRFMTIARGLAFDE